MTGVECSYYLNWGEKINKLRPKSEKDRSHFNICRKETQRTASGTDLSKECAQWRQVG